MTRYGIPIGLIKSNIYVPMSNSDMYYVCISIMYQCVIQPAELSTKIFSDFENVQNINVLQNVTPH